MRKPTTGPNSHSRTASAWARGGLVLGALAVTAAVGEVGARLFARPVNDPDTHVERVAEPGVERLWRVRDLARPNVRGIYKGALHETNSQGIRGPERPGVPGPRVVRIGITGDSVTMGSGVAEQETYVARLERMLAVERRPAGKRRDYEVLNFGLAGINAKSAMLRLARLADYYDVDVVVYGFTPNDIEGPHYEQISTPEEKRARARRAHRMVVSPSHLVRVVGPSLQSLFERLTGDRASDVEEIEHNFFENEHAAADFEQALDHFAAIVGERRGCGLVLVHTPLSELGWLYPWRRVNAHVEELARARGLHVAQTYPLFAGQDELSFWVGPLDAHPNGEGHRLLAEGLREGLEQLPRRCLRGS